MPRIMHINQNGQTLIQVLVSVAIMGIISVVFASMMVNQSRETQALEQKLASSDLEKTLIAALADGSVCQYVLNNPHASTFNSTLVTPATPQTITLSGPLYASINNSTTPSTPGPIVAQTGQPASAYSSSLIVNSIQLSITSGSGNTYLGNWLVGFDNTKTVRAIRPVSVSTTLTVDITNPAAAAITACQGKASASRYTISCANPGGAYCAAIDTTDGSFHYSIVASNLWSGWYQPSPTADSASPSGLPGTSVLPSGNYQITCAPFVEVYCMAINTQTGQFYYSRAWSNTFWTGWYPPPPTTIAAPVAGASALP